MKIPPQNLEAERAVLGSCLIDNQVIAKVGGILTAEDFYSPRNGATFKVMVELTNAGEPVDLITVIDRLKANGEQIAAADIAATTENAIPAFARTHASIVKEAARRRYLIRLIEQTRDDVDAGGDDSATIASRLGAELSKLHNDGDRGFVSIADAAVEAVKRIEKAAEARGNVTGIPTGFRDIDHRLGGIHPGELVVVGGRPSMGKSALGAGIAVNAAERGYGVAFVSIEMAGRDIATRLISRETRIESRNLRRGKLIDGEVRLVVNAAQRLGRLPFWLLDCDRSWERIKARIRALKLREPELALVLLDYVGLVHAPVSRGERHLEIGKISADAKAMAMELEIGFILLSQLNREVESREDKRPRLSDLRESGSLEQDADVVGLLFRQGYYDENSDPGETELIIAKNRNGATGVIRLKFDEKTVSFRDRIEPMAGTDRVQ